MSSPRQIFDGSAMLRLDDKTRRAPSRALRLLVMGLGLGAALAAPVRPQEVPTRIPTRLARRPTLSPDGATVAFTMAGDIWSVATAGGSARQLTHHAGTDTRPLWSPDGQWIAFSSDRVGDGDADVYLISPAGDSLRRLTWHSGRDVPTGFSPDGGSVLFESDRSSSNGIFRVAVQGGTPEPVVVPPWTPVFEGRLSPDGGSLLFAAGRENRQWWRRGYRGANASSLLVRERSGEPRVVLAEEASAFWPAWGRDGDRVYFVSDRETATKNVWRVDLDGGAAEPVTRFADGDDVLWLHVVPELEQAVFERSFGLWRLDLLTGETAAVAIDAPVERVDGAERRARGGPVTELALAPDGRKLAAVVHGEVFVTSSEGGFARNVTRSPFRDLNPDWDPASRRLVWVSDRDGNPDLYLMSVISDGEPIRLTYSDEDENGPSFSPDGAWIAYYRGKRELRLVSPEARTDLLLMEADFGGLHGGAFAWSPDSRFIAVEVLDGGQRDIVAVEVGNGTRHLLTASAYDEVDPRWSHDGRALFFRSNRSGHGFPEYTGHHDLYRLHLTPPRARFVEDAFDELFAAVGPQRNATTADRTPHVELRLEDVTRQTERLFDTRGDDGEFVEVPGTPGALVFVSDMDGRRHLWRGELLPQGGREWRPLAPGSVIDRDLEFDRERSRLYFLTRGRVGVVDLETQKAHELRFDAEYEVDRAAEYDQMLAEIHGTLERYFYDATLHGLPWRAELARYRAQLPRVSSDDDFYDLANRMVGRLDSSHTGVQPPPRRGEREETAHLGLNWRRDGDHLVVESLIPHGPLAAARSRVAPGDRIAALDGRRIAPDTNVWRLLRGRRADRVRVTLEKSDGDVIEVAIAPISSRDERALREEQWVVERARRVRMASGDRIAYVHMAAMLNDDLERALIELERDAVSRDAIILDVRWNRGGNVHDRIIEALIKPVYARWQMRGVAAVRQSTFGLADKPLVLLQNGETLSDAEILALGLKTLGRATLVGSRTYGWVVFSRDVPLMNGATFRLPLLGCYGLDGQSLETSGGIAPDVEQPTGLADELSGRDPQLERAIAVLVKRLAEGRVE